MEAVASMRAQKLQARRISHRKSMEDIVTQHSGWLPEIYLISIKEPICTEIIHDDSNLDSNDDDY